MSGRTAVALCWFWFWFFLGFFLPPSGSSQVCKSVEGGGRMLRGGVGVKRKLGRRGGSICTLPSLTTANMQGTQSKSLLHLSGFPFLFSSLSVFLGRCFDYRRTQSQVGHAKGRHGKNEDQTTCGVRRRGRLKRASTPPPLPREEPLYLPSPKCHCTRFSRDP